jgi:ribosomal protein S12 methylthiotransferase rimO
MMKRKRVSILSLGCSKNLVDSERLARRFSDAGFDARFVEELPRDGSVLIVNTCGFIGDAKEESVNTLLGAIELKNHNKLAAVYAMGCLTERYRRELTDELPELDGIYGKFDWATVVDAVAGKGSETKPWARDISTLPHYAYLKISEGCNRFCAFCAIPLITGRHHSRPVDEILDEVRELVAGGTKEFNVIAQDLSSYGRDISDDGSPLLADLIDRMAQIDGVEMIRLHYAYPSDFPYDILPVMARNPKVCKYLDIALQHIDDGVLEAMRRHINGAQTRELLARIRREVPGIHIRTTMMVGFPGETEDAFERLIDFVKEQRFERLGAFAYCEEEGTFAANNLPDSIPESVKQARLDRLMEVQQEIAFEIAESKTGSTLRVIIDECNGTEYVGRTEYDSPEVDCNVYFSSPRLLRPGDIVNVTIDGADGFDLRGRLAE